GGNETLRSLIYQLLGLTSGTTDLFSEEWARTVLADSLSCLGVQSVSQFWPALAFALGSLPPDAPELKSRAAAPGALRSMVMRAVGELLRQRAQASPLFVMLDDGHFADDMTIDALEYATLAEGNAHLWIGVFARAHFKDIRPSFGE